MIGRVRWARAIPESPPPPRVIDAEADELRGGLAGGFGFFGEGAEGDAVEGFDGGGAAVACGGAGADGGDASDEGESAACARGEGPGEEGIDGEAVFARQVGEGALGGEEIGEEAVLVEALGDGRGVGGGCGLIGRLIGGQDVGRRDGSGSVHGGMIAGGKADARGKSVVTRCLRTNMVTPGRLGKKRRTEGVTARVGHESGSAQRETSAGGEWAAERRTQGMRHKCGRLMQLRAARGAPRSLRAA